MYQSYIERAGTVLNTVPDISWENLEAKGVKTDGLVSCNTYYQNQSVSDFFIKWLENQGRLSHELNHILTQNRLGVFALDPGKDIILPGDSSQSAKSNKQPQDRAVFSMSHYWVQPNADDQENNLNLKKGRKNRKKINPAVAANTIEQLSENRVIELANKFERSINGLLNLMIEDNLENHFEIINSAKKIFTKFGAILEDGAMVKPIDRALFLQGIQVMLLEIVKCYYDPKLKFLVHELCYRNEFVDDVLVASLAKLGYQKVVSEDATTQKFSSYRIGSMVPNRQLGIRLIEDYMLAFALHPNINIADLYCCFDIDANGVRASDAPIKGTNLQNGEQLLLTLSESLEDISKTFKKYLGIDVIFSRYGGDEFKVFASLIEPDHAEILLKEVMKGRTEAYNSSSNYAPEFRSVQLPNISDRDRKITAQNLYQLLLHLKDKTKSSLADSTFGTNLIQYLRQQPEFKENHFVNWLEKQVDSKRGFNSQTGQEFVIYRPGLNANLNKTSENVDIRVLKKILEYVIKHYPTANKIMVNQGDINSPNLQVVPLRVELHQYPAIQRSFKSPKTKAFQKTLPELSDDYATFLEYLQNGLITGESSEGEIFKNLVKNKTGLHPDIEASRMLNEMKVDPKYVKAGQLSSFLENHPIISILYPILAAAVKAIVSIRAEHDMQPLQAPNSSASGYLHSSYVKRKKYESFLAEVETFMGLSTSTLIEAHSDRMMRNYLKILSILSPTVFEMALTELKDKYNPVFIISQEVGNLKSLNSIVGHDVVDSAIATLGQHNEQIILKFCEEKGVIDYSNIIAYNSVDEALQASKNITPIFLTEAEAKMALIEEKVRNQNSRITRKTIHLSQLKIADESLFRPVNDAGKKELIRDYLLQLNPNVVRQIIFGQQYQNHTNSRKKINVDSINRYIELNSKNADLLENLYRVTLDARAELSSYSVAQNLMNIVQEFIQFNSQTLTTLKEKILYESRVSDNDEHLYQKNLRLLFSEIIELLQKPGEVTVDSLREFLQDYHDKETICKLERYLIRYQIKQAESQISSIVNEVNPEIRTRILEQALQEKLKRKKIARAKKILAECVLISKKGANYRLAFLQEFENKLSLLPEVKQNPHLLKEYLDEIKQKLLIKEVNPLIGAGISIGFSINSSVVPFKNNVEEMMGALEKNLRESDIYKRQYNLCDVACDIYAEFRIGSEVFSLAEVLSDRNYKEKLKETLADKNKLRVIAEKFAQENITEDGVSIYFPSLQFIPDGMREYYLEIRYQLRKLTEYIQNKSNDLSTRVVKNKQFHQMMEQYLLTFGPCILSWINDSSRRKGLFDLSKFLSENGEQLYYPHRLLTEFSHKQLILETNSPASRIKILNPKRFSLYYQEYLDSMVLFKDRLNSHLKNWLRLQNLTGPGVEAMLQVGSQETSNSLTESERSIVVLIQQHLLNTEIAPHIKLLSLPTTKQVLNTNSFKRELLDILSYDQETENFSNSATSKVNKSIILNQRALARASKIFPSSSRTEFKNVHALMSDFASLTFNPDEYLKLPLKLRGRLMIFLKTTVEKSLGGEIQLINQNIWALNRIADFVNPKMSHEIHQKSDYSKLLANAIQKASTNYLETVTDKVSSTTKTNNRTVRIISTQQQVQVDANTQVSMLNAELKQQITSNFNNEELEIVKLTKTIRDDTGQDLITLELQVDTSSSKSEVVISVKPGINLRTSSDQVTNPVEVLIDSLNNPNEALTKLIQLWVPIRVSITPNSNQLNKLLCIFFQSNDINLKSAFQQERVFGNSTKLNELLQTAINFTNTDFKKIIELIQLSFNTDGEYVSLIQYGEDSLKIRNSFIVNNNLNSDAETKSFSLTNRATFDYEGQKTNLILQMQIYIGLDKPQLSLRIVPNNKSNYEKNSELVESIMDMVQSGRTDYEFLLNLENGLIIGFDLTPQNLVSLTEFILNMNRAKA
ncbi:MAG: hypothetical protein OHK0017_08440 [Patescibacteria group bacterium]